MTQSHLLHAGCYGQSYVGGVVIGPFSAYSLSVNVTDRSNRPLLHVPVWPPKSHKHIYIFKNNNNNKKPTQARYSNRITAASRYRRCTAALSVTAVTVSRVRLCPWRCLFMHASRCFRELLFFPQGPEDGSKMRRRLH